VQRTLNQRSFPLTPGHPCLVFHTPPIPRAVRLRRASPRPPMGVLARVETSAPKRRGKGVTIRSFTRAAWQDSCVPSSRTRVIRTRIAGLSVTPSRPKPVALSAFSVRLDHWWAGLPERAFASTPGQTPRKSINPARSEQNLAPRAPRNRLGRTGACARPIHPPACSYAVLFVRSTPALVRLRPLASIRSDGMRWERAGSSLKKHPLPQPLPPLGGGKFSLRLRCRREKRSGGLRVR